MSRFRGTVRGHSGVTSRLGTVESGVATTANGWKTGVKVVASVDEDGTDRFYILMTEGSANEGVLDELIATVLTCSEGDRRIEYPSSLVELDIDDKVVHLQVGEIHVVCGLDNFDISTGRVDNITCQKCINRLHGNH